MSTENELRIREAITSINAEITNILATANNDIRHANLETFFRLVTELEHINNTTNAPRIHQAVSTLIEHCTMNPESIQKYQELLQVTQEFMDRISP